MVLPSVSLLLLSIEWVKRVRERGGYSTGVYIEGQFQTVDCDVNVQRAHLVRIHNSRLGFLCVITHSDRR